MNPFDEKPSQPSQDSSAGNHPAADPSPTPPEQSPEQSLDDLASRIVIHPSQPGDPPFTTASPLPLSPLPPPAPDEFPVSWSSWSFGGSWLHFLFFILFIFATLIAFTIGVAVYSVAAHQPPAQAAQALQTNPAVTVLANVILFLLVFFFLYATLALLRGRPFWPTLGWLKLGARDDVPSSPSSSPPSNPWFYFFMGIALAIGVAVVNLKIKTPEHLPIQELFKNRTGALLLMGMAVLIAPLVEETVFRGYLYPLFASTAARIARLFGADPASALQTGSRSSIVATGLLFGCLHGAQLGWVLPLVAVLSVVGIIFTYARARAGTVLASYLLHLGYNSFIAFSAIFATRGFTQMPPHP